MWVLITTFAMLWNVLEPIWDVVVGWFCVFKTDILVQWTRRRYANSPLMRASSSGDMIPKPWYPTLVRCAGILLWIWAAVFTFLVVKRGLR
jgi:hypothetical protein